MQRPHFEKNKSLNEILRVNHAGEYGAKRIYSGQLYAIKSQDDYEQIKHMYEQELVHLNYFTAKLNEVNTRPTFLMPLWHIAGYCLGAITAKMGTKRAMICTSAVEKVIDEHYESQKIVLKSLGEHDLCDTVNKFQQEELEHKYIAEEYINSYNLKDRILHKAIRVICKGAIFLSKKI